MLSHQVPQSREDITLPWLQEALKQYPFDILSLEWSGGVGGGIGVMSALERLTLKVVQDGEQAEINLIVKTPPSGANPGLRDFVLNEGFCQREYQMYTKVFPSWRKFQENRNTPLKHRFRHPLCYYAAEEGESTSYKMILLLEDMQASGFSANPEGYRKGLRWSQAKKVIREMALFHGVGLAYKDYQEMKHYTGEEYSFLYTHSKDQQLVDDFLLKGIRSTCSMLREDKNVPEGLIKDLEEFNDVRKLQEMSFPREDRVGTITHQDFHIHNVMFSNHLGDSPVTILDFQGCSYANPMSDLTFFLLLNCDPSLFQENLPQVLQYYHDCLEECLYSMDSEVKYPLEEILEDYQTSLFVSVIHIVLGSPSWCFGPYTSDDSQKRYKLALVDSFVKCDYKLGLDSLLLEHSWSCSEE